ncbi:threonine synthase [Nevskia sp.]|uniref:threonine synthase n=1 Tax=Nevskia sp. TaxID=1929292 RepID=UPI0025F483B6|nr:threonine synthase [Nevskia sp.]
MSYISHLRGTKSGLHYSADVPMNLDPADGKPVEMVLDLDRLKRELPDLAWYHPQRRDLWRFGALMPLDIAHPADAAHIVALGEGCTPLREYAEHPLAVRHRFRLQVKDEGKAEPGYGANPTQSFKDRGMAVTAAMARRHGLKKLVVPTQGNAGDSLMEYAMAGGLQVAVIMPEDTPMPILGRVAAYARLKPDQVSLDLVQGSIREAGALMREKYLPHGWFNCATFQEPGWRIEGKKTLGLELAEPIDGNRHWQLPDVVVYPTGGGTGVLGMWKAWNELEALGLIDARRPRMICVQSSITPPIVNAWREGAADTTPVAGGETLCTGLNVPGGVGHFKVLDIIRASHGEAIAIDEAVTATTIQSLWRDRPHWWLSPEAAACFAALENLADRGGVKPGERVVVVNTGSMEKYLNGATRGLLG